MVQARGEKLQNVHQRIAPKIATTTLLAATDPRGPYRVDGILCPVDDLSLWRFDATSTDAASATVIVPDSGAGRWKNLVPAGGVGGGSSYKFPVRLATNAALAAYTRVGNVITANANGALGNIDGVAPALSDRVLLTTTGTASDVDNGIYVVTDLGSASTPWVFTRADDADADGELVGGSMVPVQAGTNDGGEFYTITNAAAITINTTAITLAVIPSYQDLSSTATGLGASLVGTEDAGGHYSTTDTEGNLQEVGSVASSLEVRQSTEESARSTGDSSLASAAGSLEVRLSTEESNRSDGDSSLTIADGSLTTRVSTEESARAAADLVLLRTQTLTHTDLTAAALTETINLGATISQNALVLGYRFSLTEAFSGAGILSMDLELGHDNDADAYEDGADMFTGSVYLAAGRCYAVPGPGLGAPAFDGTSTGQLTATFTSTGANVDQATTGSVTVEFYGVTIA